MAPTISRSNYLGNLSETALEIFELQIGRSLPPQYRDFLPMHNGGVPQPACFMAPEDPLEGENSPLSEREVVCFFSLHFSPWNDSTEEGSLAFPLQAAYQDLHAQNEGLKLLPIGKDWSGNSICAGLDENNQGIFFFDHEYEVATRLTSNFSDFLETLQPCQSST